MKTLSNAPLLFIAHGLGGIIAKQATVLLEDQYYNQNVLKQASILAETMLLGAPHPRFDELDQNRMRLDIVLCSIQSLSKNRLEKIREEVAVVAALCTKFQGLTSEAPVWSAYETLEIRYQVMSIFKSRTQVIVDSALATTGLGSEQLFSVDADHRSICKLSLNSPILTTLKGQIQSILQVTEVTAQFGQTDFMATVQARHLWGSTVTGSDMHRTESNQAMSSRQPSPAAATAGSQDITTYEIIPGLHGGPSHFDAVFWVSAATEGKLATSFNAIAAELGLLDPNDYGSSVISRNRVVNWLSNPIKPSHGDGAILEDTHPTSTALAHWLLVFDNADDLGLLTEYWPLGGGGSILITSRDPFAKRYMWSGSGIDLEGFGPEDAARFLQERSRVEKGDLIPAKDAIRLSARPGGLPFPLIRAAGILQQKNMTVDEFLDFYEERAFLTEIYSNQMDSLESQSATGFLDVWSLDKLKASHPEAMALLRILALMDPDSIAEFILICEKPDLKLPENYPSSKEAYEVARQALLKSSLIKRNLDTQHLSIHRIIQDSVVARMTEEDIRTNFEGLIRLLAEAWPWAVSFNHLNSRWSRCGQVFPHIDRVKDHHLDLLKPESSQDTVMTFARLLIDAGWFHLEKGNFEETPVFVDPVIALIENFTAPGALSVLGDAHFCLSGVHGYLRNVDLVRHHSERCLTLRLAVIPSGISLSIAIAYDQVGNYKLLINACEEALELERKSIEVFEALGAGAGDPEQLRMGSYAGNFARCCASIALMRLGRLNDAEAMIMSLWKRQEKLFGLMNKNVSKLRFYLPTFPLTDL
ncbi:hypothetical protein QQX98_007997 [Neonectria punicea]|uniref:DUF7779 domain-containing protein n=1 Tax=Neonectria punicea TaxID=979145 RepID=A0ABR1GW98_9HYPO